MWKKPGFTYIDCLGPVANPAPEWLDLSEQNIALCGPSGAGKSSLINSLRGLKAKDVGAAPVGVVETTITPTAYKFGAATLLDLPGAGTVKFPAEYYLAAFGLQYMKLCVIVSGEKPSEIEASLMKDLGELNQVSWIYVRTKLDIAVESEKEDHFKGVNQTISALKAEMSSTLSVVKNRSKCLGSFLVSSRDLSLGDWSQLLDLLSKQ